MEQPPQKTEFSPTQIAHTYWTELNPNEAPCLYVATQDDSGFTEQVRNALTHTFTRYTPDPEDVDWYITCLATNGSVLEEQQHGPAGRGGGPKGCGENKLWSGTKKGKHGKECVPLASGCFQHFNAVYIIDAGLCPCFRCCGSLRELARRLKSTIVVRPTTDYEIISRGRRRYNGTFCLIFLPGVATFTIFFVDLRDKPADFVIEVQRTPPSPYAWFQCPGCRRDYKVKFADKEKRLVDLRSRAPNHPIYCLNCGGICKLSSQETTGIEGFPEIEDFF